MTTTTHRSLRARRALALAALPALMAAGAACAHVTLPPGGARAGGDYEAAFRVGHACEGAASTTGIAVRLPQGFSFSEAQQRKGWTLRVDPAGGDGHGEVRWSADSPQAALPGSERAEFVVRGTLRAQPGSLWFKVLQTCDKGQVDWAQLPAAGSDSTEGLRTPAARLAVLPAGVAAVDLKDGWVRAAVPGQSGTGAFMKLSAPAGAKLVGVETPVADVAEVHEMKMVGDRMQMRGVPALALPARQTVELKPGGYHLMLMDLKQPVRAGAKVPITLQFEEAGGVKTRLTVELPVSATPPGGGADPGAHAHKH